MKIWIINRKGQQIGFETAYNCEYGVDILSQDKSKFPLLKPAQDYEKGNFILAKEEDGSDVDFFGVIDSYEDKTIMANDITILANFEFPAGYIKGQSFELHFQQLLQRYLLNDPTKDLNGTLVVDTATSTPHLYQPKETPTPTNLMKYMVNAYKKYNIVWRFDRYEGGKIYTVIEKVTEKIQLKNNLDFLRNWEVSTTAVGKDTENMLIIVDKKMTDVMNPKILSTWYLKDDNTVTQDKNDPHILKPTITKINVYDTEQSEENKPTYEQVANTELKGSYYSHEISVEAQIVNPVLNIKNMYNGMLAKIVYEGKTYESVLSGYRIEEGSGTIKLQFGNIRSRLSELLE